MAHRFGALGALGALCVLCALPLLSSPSKSSELATERPSRRESSVPTAFVSPRVPVVASAEVRRYEARSVRRSSPQMGAWRALDEDEAVLALGELGSDDPELSLRLARDARARFPGSPRAVELDYFELRSLVNLGKLDEAIRGARALVAAHPEHPLANEVARHLLTHPMTDRTEVGRD